MTEKLGTAARDTFRSLHIRNFRLFFSGQLISQTGTWLTMVAQTLLVLRLTDSGVAVGLLTAFQFGPVLVLGAWAGSIADRADKRRLLIRMQTLGMVQSLVLAAVLHVLTSPFAANMVSTAVFHAGPWDPERADLDPELSTEPLADPPR